MPQSQRRWVTLDVRYYVGAAIEATPAGGTPPDITTPEQQEAVTLSGFGAQLATINQGGTAKMFGSLSVTAGPVRRPEPGDVQVVVELPANGYAKLDADLRALPGVKSVLK